MKAEAGWGVTAAAVALAAYMGISSQSGGKATTGSASAASRRQGPAAASGDNKSAFERGPCVDLETTIQTFLLTSPKQIAAPASCFVEDPENDSTKTGEEKSKSGATGEPAAVDPAADLRREAAGLQFVIAILPDPLHTHFSLTFDRLAEAIQQGVQDEGYYYDSSWLPWEKEEPSLVLLSDQDTQDDRIKAREDQPGILLFRKRPDTNDGGPGTYKVGLAVLVVGEEPTAGVHKRQFENAMNWIAALQPRSTDALAPRQEPVKILGPTFSGSLPSLAQLLGEKDIFATLVQPRGTGPAQPLWIYSGTITSEAVVDWFVNQTKGLGAKPDTKPEEKPLIRFRSFQGGGDQLIERYRNYLVSQGIGLSHLAVVSEDETVFGGYGDGKSPPTTSGPCTQELHGKGSPACLYYPRDISALRNAYQKESIFSSTATQQAGETAKRTLSTDLADPEGQQHDTIRNYSAEQTALSQEAVMLQIVSMLRAHGAQYVVLRSSNPLDQLFLSHFLRVEYPEGRVVIEGSDLLLRRESGAATLSGIMTLTTYPLLPWEPDWTGPASEYGKHSHRVFAQSLAEGNYVATRFLLHSPACVSDNTSPSVSATPDERYFLPPQCEGMNIRDYAPPFWANVASATNASRQPATWLSVLGRDGFWPVAALAGPEQNRAYRDAEDDPAKERLPGWILAVLQQIYRAMESVASLIHLTVWSLLGWLFVHALPSGASAPDLLGWPPMPNSMKLCLLTIFLWSVFHLHCCARPSLTVKPGHRAHFARLPGNSHSFLIVMGSVTVALFPVVLGWGYGAMSLAGEPVPHAWWYRAFLPLIWLTAGAAVCANAWVESNDYPRTHAPLACSGWLAHCRKAGRDLLNRRGVIWKASRKALGSYVACSALLYCIVDFSLNESLTDSNRIPTYWRSIHLTTGVSPLVPFLALTAGLYLWFWYSLQGLALFGADRPSLPTKARLKITLPDGTVRDSLALFSKDDAADPIERLCQPFAIEIRVAVPVLWLALLLAVFLIGGVVPVRSLGPASYSIVFCLGLSLFASLMLANAWQLLRVWLRLRQLLVFLDKTPLRRTLKALRGYSWGSVWKMGGNVLDVRYKLLSRQFECLTHLVNLFKCVRIGPDTPLCEAIRSTNLTRGAFADWFSEHWDDWKARDPSTLKEYQDSVAETAAVAFTGTLVPRWMSEKKSLLLDDPAKEQGDGKDNDAKDTDSEGAAGVPPDEIRVAEELVCLVYLGFIQNVLGRMRTIVMQIMLLFVAATASVATYPFDPRPALSAALMVLLLFLGTVIVIVYSQMHRDATLSYVTNTEPGELGSEFWLKLAGFAAGPLLGLLATVFPELPGSLFSLLQPGLESIK